MGKFSVSQEAYHELTQQKSNLPRSYLVEACQQSLDDEWNITKTPGMCPGAELPFKDLLEKELRKQVSKSYNWITNLRLLLIALLLTEMLFPSHPLPPFIPHPVNNPHLMFEPVVVLAVESIIWGRNYSESKDFRGWGENVTHKFTVRMLFLITWGRATHAVECRYSFDLQL